MDHQTTLFFVLMLSVMTGLVVIAMFAEAVLAWCHRSEAHEIKVRNEDT